MFDRTDIHASALVHPNASLGSGVKVGAFTVINDGVFVGDNTIIESHSILGHPSPLAEGGSLHIGRNSHIRSHSIFYHGSTFGDGLTTGHRVTVREKTVAGDNLQIGTLSDVQGHCHIGNYVRFHSNVHIGQKSKIGDFVWIFPYVVLTNDPHPPSSVCIGATVEDFAAIATMSVVLPGVNIGKGALVGAHSSVSRDVAPETVVVGVPAKFVCRAEEIKLKDGSGRAAYPWRTHFSRGYPEHVVKQWLDEVEVKNKLI